MELPIYERKDKVPLPPKDARVQTTACAYCAVGCGYKVFTWPVGTEGGLDAKANAFGANFPTGFEGVWVSPNQCTIVMIDGKPHHGTFHPEMGHVRVRRAPGDRFAGICPIHGDCLEGLASGPAIAARAGRPADTIAPSDPMWTLVANGIAGLMASLILTLAPHRIVIGGGVGEGQPALLALIHNATAKVLGGYLPSHDLASLKKLIVHPALGHDAGVYGAIAVAMEALGGQPA